MSRTVTYDFDEGHEAQLLPFDFVSGNAAIASLSHGGIIGVGDQFGHTQGNIFLTDSTGRLSQSLFGPIISTNSAVDELSNGNIVIAGEDSDSIRFSVVTGNFGDIVIPASDFSLTGSTNADVVGLSGGGFVVGYQHAISSSNSDVVVDFFANDGTPGTSVSVDTSSAKDTGVSLAQLEGGNVVVAWTRTIGSQSEIWYAIRSATGAQVKGATLLDTDGTINKNVSVTATKGGGFALAYEDNQWGASAAGITLAKADAQGNNAVRVQVKTFGESEHIEPDITQLSNGLFALTVVRSSPQTFVELIDGNGNELAARDILRSPDSGGNPHNPSIANIGVGRLAVVYSDPTAGFTGGQIVNIVRNSTVDPFTGANTIKGDDFIDNIVGGDDGDTLSGGNGNDIIDGGSGTDTIKGDDGDDFITDGGGFDSIYGGNGNDTVDYRTATGSVVAEMQGAAQSYIMVGGFFASEIFSVETILGGTVDDSLTGDEFSNTFWGNEGADTLDGGAGADFLAGGEGSDTYVVDDAEDVVSEVAAYDDNAYPADGEDTVKSGVVSINLTNTGHFAGDIENIILTGTGNLSATGNNLANKLTGNSANNTLDGGGNADTMTGGAGNDVYVVDNKVDTVVEVVDASGGTADRVRASVDYKLAAGVGVEQMMTTNAADTAGIDLTGNALRQAITGNAGANSLSDGGGAGDALAGLQGNDTYVIGSSDTTITDSAISGGTLDRIKASVNYMLASGVGIERMETTKSNDTTKIELTGNTLKQSIFGNAGDNRLSDGGGAGDTLSGLQGNDTYIVKSAATIVVETTASSGGTADRIATGVTYVLGAGISIERITTNNGNSAAALDITGNDIAQSITGNEGGNRIDGKGGIDTLVSGGGGDTFIFSTVLTLGIDRISDFNVALDTVELKKAIFAAAGNTGTLLVDAFWSSAAGVAHDGSDRIVYDSDDGKLYYDADGNKAGGVEAVIFATIGTGLSLNQADFIIA